MSRKKKIKALVLLSGGLDSMLAVKVLQEQKIEIEGVCFYSNFFGCEAARRAAKQLGVKLKEIDLRDDFLKVLRRPKYGYGTGLNPCIDCHSLMFKKAKEIMKKGGFDFVASGEVLNERPMSQTRQSLEIVEKEVGLTGYLLRPLSAKLLAPTIPEKRGLVDRQKLLDISGRSRKKQIELAKKFGLKEYPTPAGGCMLTQEGFASRLKNLMHHKSDFTSEDVELIKIGRHFWFGKTQIVLGRNKEENQALHKMRTKNDIIIEPDNFIGPTALIRGKRINSSDLERAKELIVQFSPKAKDAKSFQFAIINFH